MGVITTEKDKRKVLEHEDLLKRLIKVRTGLDRVVLERMLDDRGDSEVAALCIEALSYPRNLSAAAKVAATWGIMVGYSLPIIQRSPQEVKLAVCGNRFASKAAIEAELEARFPNAASLLGDMPKSRWEHAFDSLAVTVACIDDPLIKALAA
jgi:Holliday junction resolvasome RuvABC endonuclease subunit